MKISIAFVVAPVAALLVALIPITLLENSATASQVCPLCPAISAQTIAEEMESMDVVLIGKLAERLHEKAESPASGSETARFEVLEILKGKALLPDQKQIEVPFSGEQVIGSRFLLTGVDPPELAWNTPVELSDDSMTYVKQVFQLGFDRLQRLEFFQRHLENKDELIARDAYDEFARAPYEDILSLKPKMDRQQVIEWIRSDAIPSSRRRLYFMMLGVCGTKENLPLLEKMLRSADPQERTGIDSIIACYLTLAGEAGLPLVEDLFLKNQQAEYTDTYSAVMAIRFHGTDGDVIPKEKLVPLLHNLLDRPRLADLVIPDLARWEDWSVLDRLVEMFETSDGKTSWVRVPIINYVKACPLPEATKQLEKLKEMDPDAFRRANVLFPFGDGEPIDN